RPTITGKALFRSAGQSADVPRLRIDAAQQAVETIRHEQVAIVAHDEVMNAIEGRRRCRAAIASRAFRAGPGEDMEHAILAHLEHSIAMLHLGDDHLTRGCKFRTEWLVQRALRCGRILLRS